MKLFFSKNEWKKITFRCLPATFFFPYIVSLNV